MTGLQWDPDIKTPDIGVGVTDGVVTLIGYVDSDRQKWTAGRVASRIFGVKAVTEKIQVRYPDSVKRSDEDIAWSVSNALVWNASIPPDRVKVRVQDGVVTLSGEIGWEYQKFAAGEAVRYLRGVVLVVNNITIKPKVNSRW